MIHSIEQIIKSYKSETIDDITSILREVIQSIILIGLSRSGFFNKASFYGGTALRIFYGLNRFSEDLDFTLNMPDSNFKIDSYIEKINEVALSYGITLDIQVKKKNIETPIESAFAKINTYQAFLCLKIDEKLTNLLHKDQLIKVKLEVDCNPATGFKTETKWLNTPEFAPVIVLNKESLFSGKIHAILCRQYNNRVKGRDYYDFLFYIQNRIKPNMEYLKNKLIETGKITENDIFNIDVLKKMLNDQFEKVDFEEVKKDTMRFVFNTENLSFYSKELFIQTLDYL